MIRHPGLRKRSYSGTVHISAVHSASVSTYAHHPITRRSIKDFSRVGSRPISSVIITHTSTSSRPATATVAVNFMP